MKNFAFVTLIAALTSACNTERQILPPTTANSTSQVVGRLTGRLNTASIAHFSKIGLASNLNVSLQSLDGTLVQKTSALQANTSYRIKVVGEGISKIQIRACFGFDLLEEKQQANAGVVNAYYLIKTHSDVSEPLLVSLIPLQTVGSSSYREQAQNFQLTKSSR